MPGRSTPRNQRNRGGTTIVVPPLLYRPPSRVQHAHHSPMGQGNAISKHPQRRHSRRDALHHRPGPARLSRAQPVALLCGLQDQP